MKFTFISYADANYADRQKNLMAFADKEFDAILAYTRDDLIQTEFYQQNKAILDLPRGAGYWLWKPYFIRQTLNKIKNGDAVFYMDCGDIFRPGLAQHVRDMFNAQDYIFPLGLFIQRVYTKRDCFILMDCDTVEYHEFTQLEAGNIVIKKTPEMESLIDEWIYYGTNPHIITDMPNICGSNFEDFIDHRHDQSILTNLIAKHKLSPDTSLRDWVVCNAF